MNSQTALAIFHTQFENICKNYPDNEAIRSKNGQYSYAQLNQRSNEIAHSLLKLELPIDACIGVCLERSADAIASMIGILKAGAAFVPLDPDYPVKRLAFMINDASIDYFITNKYNAERFSTLDIKALVFGENFPTCQNPTNPDIEIASDRLAYIMYTSGSTGNPKGVQIEHGSLTQYCVADIDAYKITSDDCTLQFSTLNFDISIEEIFPPLMIGSSVAIRPQQHSNSQNELSALIQQYKVTAVHIATAYWHEWIDLMVATHEKVPPSINLMVVTGEKVSVSHYRKWLSLIEKEILWANAYGPTETTVSATVFIPPKSWQGTSMPIGKPLKGYSAYILNSKKEEVSDNKTGELYISGPALARGYLNQQALTDKVFINCTIQGISTRLYKTGDLARFLDNGDIEYAGRIDHQIKIDSYRIEPGEIEEQLNQHPEVLESLVSTHEDSGRKQIISYIAKGENKLSSQSLHDYAIKTLPAFMRPSSYIILEEFPKTINGKIDRQALPSIDMAESPHSDNYVSPKTKLQSQLCNIWENVLGLHQVGVEDNFFNLGGNSLMVTKSLALIYKETKISLSTRDFYAFPTVEELATRLDNHHDQLTTLCDKQKSIPLTLAQSQLYYQQELYPEVNIFNIYEKINIQGILDEQRIIKSLGSLIDRHPILSSKVIERNGDLFQQITNPIKKQIDFIDFSQQEVNIKQWVEDKIYQNFNLRDEVAHRFFLVKIQHESYILLLITHHLFTDGWSMAVLLRELNALYTDVAHELSTGYSFLDFANDENTRKKGESYKTQLQYWQNKLKDLSPLQLPQYQHTTRDRQYTANEISFTIPTYLIEKIDTFCKHNKLSRFSLLLAVYNALLFRYSNCHDIAIAIAHSGRSHQNLENTVGFFVKTLIARTLIEDSDNFDSLAEKVNNTCLEAFANQDTRLSDLVNLIHDNQNKNSTAFSPFLFLLQDIEDAYLDLPELSCKHETVQAVSNDYDITLELSDKGDHYSARLIYSDELYNTKDMQRFSDHYPSLLEAALSDSKKNIAILNYLSYDETEYLVRGLNQTNLEYDHELSVEQLIWDQAIKTPNKIAASFEGIHYSYKELCHRADCLAAYILSDNQVNKPVIGVYLNRNLDTLVVLLAIMRTGSAYLPIDPELPQERIKYILEDSKTQFLITESNLVSKISKTNIKTLVLDQQWQNILELDSTIVNNNVSSESLAYIIYTSGSSGKPKGVEVTRKNVINFILSMQKRPGIEPIDKLLAVTTISFDISVLELYLPLASGASIVITSQEASTDGNVLNKIIESESITMMQATPATWRLLLESPWKNNKDFKALCGGEALPKDLVSPILDRVGSLWNMYGPTETTVWSSCTQVTDTKEPITIGKPIANTQLYVLSTQDQLCPINVPGEICISGDGVARGYTNKPDLTAKQFVKFPFGDSKKRMYRTGDFGRWTDQGKLEYLSRLDNQVKLRGYRIELSEIESTLSDHSNIDHGVVIVHTDSENTSNLAAYIVANNEGQSSIEHLIAHLSQDLPEYMVPKYYMWLDALPQTPNGKLDRKNLPDPVNSGLVRIQKSQPITPTQKRLAALWQELLGKEEIDLEDNFFNAGGHSLLAMRFIALAREEFNLDIPVRAIMKSKLINIAEFVDEANTTESGAEASKSYDTLSDNERLEPIALTKNQLQLYYQQQLFEQTSFYNVYEKTDIHGHLDTPRLLSSLHKLINRHKILSTTISINKGVLYQRYREDLEPEIFYSELDTTNNIDTWTEKVTQKSFDLINDFPYRVYLVKINDNHHRLVLVLHHIFVDGWSIAIMMRELSKIYSDDSDTLPDSYQFLDYAAHTSKHGESSDYQQQLIYFTNNLKNLTPLQLPQSIREPSERDFSASEVNFTLSKPLTEKINKFSQKHKISRFNLLLSAFKCLLYRYTNSHDLAIAIAHSGRSLHSIEQTVGYFAKTLIIRTEIEKDDTFTNLIERVKENSLNAFSNQDARLVDIVSSMNIERSLTSAPFSPYLFLLQDIPNSKLQLDNLECIESNISSSSSEYDLSLELTDKGERYDARLIYANELFNNEDMHRFGNHFTLLLEQAITHCDQKISTLNYLSSDERVKLTDELNQTKSSYNPDIGIEQLIWEQAMLNPNKIAASFEDSHYSYQELCHKADCLAAHLIKQGITPGTLVGIFLERNLNLLISLLAVMRAGAAYLPLDPEYPQERISYILDDAKSPILITESTLLADLPTIQADILVLDQQWDNILKQAPLQGDNNATAESLAYIIYTSGSTGKPKGVELTRKNVTNFILSMQQKPGLQPDDVLLAVTTISFDIAVLELYLPLVTGASLIIASREAAVDGHQLNHIIQNKHITFMQATPATWRLLLESSWKKTEGFKALVGGEALPKDIIAPILERVDSLWNMYGPTETTVWSSCSQVLDPTADITIGQPIANTHIYILGPEDQLCPINIPGELCISGDGVARGYSNRADLTDQQFVTDPFQHGKRMYRTGDSARWTNSGQLEYISRLDNQIKLRGYRIELGEIESNLSQHYCVNHAIVVVHTDATETSDLAAYLVASDQGSCSDKELIEHLSQDLPNYMVPRYFMWLDVLPKTPNGKVDRKALPSPIKTNNIQHNKLPPTTPTQKSLASLWQDLLGDKNIGLEDNFFALGGHSLLAMKFIAIAKDALNFSVPVRSIMTSNLGQIANLISPNENTISSHHKQDDIIQPLFITYSNTHLYGVLHSPNFNAHKTPVLICQPVGHEYMRSHRSLRMLATDLAKQGHYVLRFDYCGTGDSSGDMAEINLEQWQADTKAAYNYLLSTANTSKAHIIGVRFGAALAMSSNLDNLDKIILWDPIIDSQQYIDQLYSHNKFALNDLDRYRFRQKAGSEYEIMGYEYNQSLLESIRSFKHNYIHNLNHHSTLVVSNNTTSYSSIDDISIIKVEDTQRWDIPEAMDDILLAYPAINAIKTLLQSPKL